MVNVTKMLSLEASGFTLLVLQAAEVFVIIAMHMAQEINNRQVAALLRRVSAAYLILGENRFKIIAYDRAADSIEHLTDELRDMWEKERLGDVPGVGSSIAKYMDELFKTGKVKHFEDILGKLPTSIYPLLLVPGIGPKKAYRLVTEFKLENPNTVIDDLATLAEEHKIATLEGFGEKSEEGIIQNIGAYHKGQIKENRMVLSVADGVANQILAYLQESPHVLQADKLGSLRRQVSTIGDIDLAVSTKHPKEVLERFVAYPHEKIIDQGEAGATIRLHSGRQVDLRVQTPEAYGAMLQYFTGSKHHNIKLRALALNQGLSLNEYGIKHIKSGKRIQYKTEEALYSALGLPYIPPEIREDTGEIEAALCDAQKKQPGLPKLIELSDIKGDLHMHMDFQFQSSHDLGASSLSQHLDKAVELGYEYVGISDHNPSVSTLESTKIALIMKQRKDHYEQQYYSWKKKNNKSVHYLLLCEVDITQDGTLALPDEAFEYVDGIIVSIHSSFTQDKKTVTRRILRALSSHPKVRIFGHPSGRLLQKRDGVDADWTQVFALCKENDIALEINASPERLDLSDGLVRQGIAAGIKCIIDTDSHAVDQMSLMRYGISVARRGWTQRRDIINTLGYNEFERWLTKKGE